MTSRTGLGRFALAVVAAFLLTGCTPEPSPDAGLPSPRATPSPSDAASPSPMPVPAPPDCTAVVRLFADTFFERWDLEGDRSESPEPGEDARSSCGTEGKLRLGSATDGYVMVYFDRVGSDHDSPADWAEHLAKSNLQRICGDVINEVKYEVLLGGFDYAARCLPKNQQAKAGVALVRGLDVVGIQVNIRRTDVTDAEARKLVAKSAEIIARICFTLMSRR